MDTDPHVHYHHAETQIDLRLEDGSTETINLQTEEPAELYAYDPLELTTGDTVYHVEILGFELVGESEVLFPGQQLRMRAGKKQYPHLKPSVGFALLEAGDDLSTDGADSRQFIFLELETPSDVLHNRHPALLVARIHAIPPVGETYTQEGIVDLYAADGTRKAAKDSTQTTLLA